MRTKEELYDLILEEREFVKDPANTRCICPETLCEWHGKCKECVALHRYHNEHIPKCLQPIIREKVKTIAATIEMETSLKQGTPIEHRQYVKERDEQSK